MTHALPLIATFLLVSGTPQHQGARPAPPALTAGDADRLSRALEGEPATLADASWSKANAFVAALASRPARRALARGLAAGTVHPGALWALDRAASRWAAQATGASPHRSVLERGLAAPLIALLRADAAAGECPAFTALGQLAEAADGWYGEAVDDALFALIEGSPPAVKTCWREIAPLGAGIHLQSTAFCVRSDAVMRLYTDDGDVLAFLQRAQAACAGTATPASGVTK